MRNITFSAKDESIAKARKRAAADKTTLNDKFLKWSEKYAHRPESVVALIRLMEKFEYVQTARTFRRDEMNERYILFMTH